MWREKTRETRGDLASGARRERMREGRSRRKRKRERGSREGQEDEADQRRVESREAGSVPFSRSQAPIPFGSVAVLHDVSVSRLLERTRTTDERRKRRKNEMEKTRENEPAERAKGRGRDRRGRRWVR